MPRNVLQGLDCAGFRLSLAPSNCIVDALLLRVVCLNGRRANKNSFVPRRVTWRLLTDSSLRKRCAILSMRRTLT